MLPSSYENSNFELNTLENKVINSSYQLDTTKAIQYVKTLNNNEQLDKFMEVLEDLGTLPFLPYDDDSHILDYLEDEEYNVAEVSRVMALMKPSNLRFNYMTNFYLLIPIQSNQVRTVALDTYNKNQLIHDLKLYQKYPNVDLTVKEPTLTINDISKALKRHSEEYNNHINDMLASASHKSNPFMHMKKILYDSYPEYYK